MPLNYRTLLYGPAQRHLGVPGRMVLTDGTVLDGLMPRDQTSGIVVEEGEVGLQTLRPAAWLPAADLLNLGVELADVDGATLTLHPDDAAAQTVWVVGAHIVRQSPAGVADGKVTLLLEKAS